MTKSLFYLTTIVCNILLLFCHAFG